MILEAVYVPSGLLRGPMSPKICTLILSIRTPLATRTQAPCRRPIAVFAENSRIHLDFVHSQPLDPSTSAPCRRRIRRLDISPSPKPLPIVSACTDLLPHEHSLTLSLRSRWTKKRKHPAVGPSPYYIEISQRAKTLAARSSHPLRSQPTLPRTPLDPSRRSLDC